MDDFTRLDATSHMLKWLASDYKSSIRYEIESILSEQVPGSKLDEMIVASDPQWLTGAKPTESDPTKAILVRTGVAFELTLTVLTPTGESFNVQGVYSWVGVKLNEPKNAEQRIWLDLDGTLEEFGSEGELKTRLYFA